MDPSLCEFCGNDIPLAKERCPHCARPGLFPNVRAAEASSEQQALNRRYQAALREAEDRGAKAVVESFESAVQASRAVLARPLRELDRLASPCGID